MPRTNTTSKGASGTGSIRKITTTRNGKQYTYWQARYTAGYDPGTGKQIQRSITGKTQKEVAEKLKATTSAIDCGSYIEPNKQTLGQWLDIWVDTYLLNIKPRTLDIYKSDIRLHIKPLLGAVRLDMLDAPTIQTAYIKLLRLSKKHPKGLSPKTIKNIHGVLHKALRQAVLIGHIRFNPADACVLPRIEKSKIVPFDDDQVALFLKETQGNRFEAIFVTTLFTGVREGEILGLTWDCVDFERSIITIDKQMQLHQEKGCKAYLLVPTKNDEMRTIVAAPTVMPLLKRHRMVQAQQKLLAGAAWGNTSNLGHATAAFTLDVYGHVTDQMKEASAARMEAFIKSVSGS